MDGSEGGASPQPSWRDHLKIHPAANLCPPMSRDELLALGEDIKANGSEPTIPIVLLQPKKGPPLLLDGRNRLDAMEMVGLPTLTPDGKPVNSKTFEEHDGVDPYAYVLTANLHRRHLTGDQRGDLIRKIKVERPDLSTRAVADIVGTSKDTVHRAINKLVEPAGVSNETADPDASPAATPGEEVDLHQPAASASHTQPDQPDPPADPQRVKGKDGKSYPVKKEPKPRPKAPKEPKPAPGSFGQTRSIAITEFSKVLHCELAPTLEDIVKLLQNETKHIVNVPKEKRIIIARGYLSALGLTLADLEPVG